MDSSRRKGEAAAERRRLAGRPAGHCGHAKCSAERQAFAPPQQASPPPGARLAQPSSSPAYHIPPFLSPPSCTLFVFRCASSLAQSAWAKAACTAHGAGPQRNSISQQQAFAPQCCECAHFNDTFITAARAAWRGPARSALALSACRCHACAAHPARCRPAPCYCVYLLLPLQHSDHPAARLASTLARLTSPAAPVPSQALRASAAAASALALD
jgi:hypothetical protein